MTSFSRRAMSMRSTVVKDGKVFHRGMTQVPPLPGLSGLHCEVRQRGQRQVARGVQTQTLGLPLPTLRRTREVMVNELPLR
jgi:hypothetical protein